MTRHEACLLRWRNQGLTYFSSSYRNRARGGFSVADRGWGVASLRPGGALLIASLVFSALVAVLVAFSPFLALMIVGGVLLAGVCIRYPRMGAGLTLVALACMDQAPKEIGVIEGAFGWLASVTVLWAIIRHVGVKRVRTALFGHAILRIVTAFLAFCVLSCLMALRYGTAVDDWVRGLAPMAGFAMIYPAAGDLKTPQDHLRLMRWFGIAAAVFAGIAIVLALPHAFALLSGDRITYYDFNTMSPFTAFGFCAVLILGLRREERLLARVFWVALSVVMGAIIILTYSRSLIVAAALTTIVIVARYRRRSLAKWFFVGLVLLTVVGVLGVIGLPFQQTLAGRFGELQEYKVYESRRLLEARIAISNFSESPLVGKGLGYQFYVPTPSLGSQRSEEKATVGYIHNWLLYWLLTGGVGGTLLCAAITLWPLWRLFKLLFRTELREPAWEAPMLFALCICLIAFAVGTFEATIRTFHQNLPHALALGMLVAFDRSRKRFDPLHGSTRSKSSPPVR